MTNHLCHLVVIFALLAAPVCCPAAGMVRTVAELVAAVDNGKDGDTIELAAGKFELERTLELKAGMALKGAGMNKTTVTHEASWNPATEALPDPEMRLEGLDADAYLIRIRRDTRGVTISDMTLHGPQLHGAIFAWFHTGLHLHHLRIKDTRWCGVRTFGMKNAKIHDCEFVNAGGRWEKGKPGVTGGITGGGVFACWMADTEIWNSGTARVENNQLVNINDTARYQNKATGKPQGPEQPLKFECGVNGELTVDGWKTRKKVAK